MNFLELLVCLCIVAGGSIATLEFGQDIGQLQNDYQTKQFEFYKQNNIRDIAINRD